MLMDEPVTGLDTPSQEELFKVLDTLKKEMVTVMFALHDLKLAARKFDRVILLNRVMVGIGSADEVFTNARLNQAYGDKIQIFSSNQDLTVMDDSCCGELEP